MTKRRVVVTGMGIISPLGLNVESSWQAVLAGKSGVASLPPEIYGNFSTTIAASVKDFDAELYISGKDVRKTDLFIQYGMAAAAQAIEDANLGADENTLERTGVLVGSGIGGLPMIEKNHQQLLESGPRRISPFFIPAAIINMVSGQISIKHGFRGPNLSAVSACTTGTHNIGLAARLIAYGDADVMVAGGAEMATTPLGLGGFAACRALSTRNHEPTRASRPWDRERDGFVLGDGAGVMILESYEHAKARGARIYAELIGFGMSADAYHMTLPKEDAGGAVSAMRLAIKDAQINPTEIDYINAHGTSTPAGDPQEVLAVKTCFGDHAYKLAMSSTKSMTGHLIAAAGSVEAIFSILAIRDQVAPPTINLDDPDEGCDLNLVPHTPQQRKISTVLSNSFGFGGTNGTVIFRKI